MTGTAAQDGPADVAKGISQALEPSPTLGRRSGAKRRRREGVARPHAVMVRLSDAEWGVVSVAAAAAGLTPTGYVGTQAVAVARGTVSPLPAQVSDVVRELVEARRQLVRYGQLLNQAVARLHVDGLVDARLDAAVAGCALAVASVSGATTRLARR